MDVSGSESQEGPSRVEVESERTILDGFLRIEEAQVRWERFDGSMSDTFVRRALERGDAVAAVVWDATTGELLVTRQFRYPAYRREEGWVLELVAGTVEGEAEPADVIRTEILEELGYAAEKIEPVSVFFVSPGGSTERVHLYVAHVREEGRTGPGGGIAAEGEDIEIVRLTEADAADLLSAGAIRDAKTLIGLQWWFDNREQQTDEEVAVTEDRRTCFVIMPFGEKRDAEGNLLDFDMVYAQLIRPAVESIGWNCVRCDDITGAGWIHRDMFESLATADAAVVDLTTLNPNVFYELGIRHALRDKVTVLLRRAGTDIPFNIEGLRVIDYEPQFREPKETMERIQRFLTTGLTRKAGDSPVHEVLNLNTQVRSSPLTDLHKYRYPVGDDGRALVIVTGDLHDIKGADVWVNSENTCMQMARWYDKSISGLIRYLGRTIPDDGPAEDTIADELLAKTGGASVNPGAVVVTGSGALRERGVKRICHVASAIGYPGEGYLPVQNLEDCVSNVLEAVDADPDLTNAKVLFPLIGTGTAKTNPSEVVERLFQPAIRFLRSQDGNSVSEVWFLAYTWRDLDACQAACGRMGVTLQSSASLE